MADKKTVPARGSAVVLADGRNARVTGYALGNGGSSMLIVWTTAGASRVAVSAVRS